MHLRIRDKVINLDDDLEINFATEYYFWDEYNRIKDSAKNIAQKKDLLNYRNALYTKYTKGGLEHSREFVEQYDTQFFEYRSNDKCIYKSKDFGTNDTLILYVNSHAGIENRMNLQISSIPDKIKDLDKCDILVLNEHPLRYPESLYPSYLVLGCSDENDTFEKMCDSVRKEITKDYKSVIVYGDSKHAASTLSIAHNLSEIVTHAFIIHGQSCYAWDESGWVQSYLTFLEKREKIYKKTGHLDDTMIRDISGPWIFHILKSFGFKKMNVDDRILSPYKYHNEYNFKVDYYYGKYDEEYYSHLKYLFDKHTGDIEFHCVDYSSSNSHFIKPHLERKIFPEYIKRITDE